ncbi:ninein isoform X2 [Microcaecilia unicolor]|uniref:Ninein isoform X2 n=1 Tax=Microcaecilia unicolor TaxID=1415580 RepID=A0A6P7YZ44_9AMPH|nr:ninein isoform X2 [Microcaecilia unicolor]
MDEAEQDQYEARLKELFDSFDSTGTGSLGQEELTDLCHMLQLEEVAPTLQQTLLQDNLSGRVHFDQFKEALILILSSTLSSDESFQEQDSSPEAQPKYIKDGKRYGRRSLPELQDSMEEFAEVTVIEAEDEDARSSHIPSGSCDELWRTQDSEEYEAEGQLRFWNPDDLSASQNLFSPSQDWIEEKLQVICEDLGITRDGLLNRKKLISICEQYGFQNLEREVLEDAFQNAGQDDTMSLQEFFYEVFKNGKPLTPSASTPYRQLKRHLSMQSFESGRRTTTPSTMMGTIGFCLFSFLDDGTGYSSVEKVLDTWQEEGIENSQAVLKALDFDLDGKINLTELTMALENELLVTKNGILQAALASFKSEIKHLLERADQAAREKEKLRSDLEKNEKLKTLMASEVDDHHAAIEQRNEYNLRKLDEEYRERTAALKTELGRERDHILQQASKQHLELEQEIEKMKIEENYIRDRLALSLKENSRLERELLENSEKMAEFETLANTLQRNLEHVLKEKFGDLDPSSAEFFLQEERLAVLKKEHERQCRELQDRIDELQCELEECHVQGSRAFRGSLKSSLSEEFDGRSGGLESDQGLGSEDCPPSNMSIEAEMAIEQMKEQHLRELEELKLLLLDKVEKLEEIQTVCEKEKEDIKHKCKETIQKTEEQISDLKIQTLELQEEMEKLKDDHQQMACRYDDERRELQMKFDEEKAHLQDQLKQREALEVRLKEEKERFNREKEELSQNGAQRTKEVQERMSELERTLQKETNELECGFREQITNLTERHAKENDQLRRELQEKHRFELQEERQKMKTEYERRTSEAEVQFSLDLQATLKRHEEVLRQLEECYREELRNLTEQHCEQKSQWQFEKDEIIQESVEAQERLKETLEKEKVSEKELLEKKHKEQLNKLTAEKLQLEEQLQDLKNTARRQEENSSDRILQLQNDLLEELKERDQLQSEAEGKAAVAHQKLENLEKEYEQMRQDLTSKLLISESLYKETCERAERKKADMAVEISKLQSTISELQQETLVLTKLQADYNASMKENSVMKTKLTELQNHIQQLEEDKGTLRNLQKVHEQAVKENVKMASEIYGLQQRLQEMQQEPAALGNMDGASHELLGHGIAQTKVSVRQMQRKQVGDDRGPLKNVLGVFLQDVENEKDLISVLELRTRIKDLEESVETLSKIEKTYEETKAVNSDLRGQVSQLKEEIKKLSVGHSHVTGETKGMNYVVPEQQVELEQPEGIPVNISKLKTLYEDGQKENTSICENFKMMEIMYSDVVEKNRNSSSEVSDIQSPEKITEPLLKLVKLCEEPKQENTDVINALPQFQGKILELEKEEAAHSEALDLPKEVKTETLNLKSEIKTLVQEKLDAGHTQLKTKFEEVKKENLKCRQENSKLWEKVKELESTCDSCLHEKTDMQSEKLTMQKQLRKLEERFAALLNWKKKHEASIQELQQNRKLDGQTEDTRNPNVQAENMEKKPITVMSDSQSKCNELRQKVEVLSCENKRLGEEKAALKNSIEFLREEGTASDQKRRIPKGSREEMWQSLETAKEKQAVQKMVEKLNKQVSELKARNQQLISENAELYQKNVKNQDDVQDLNRRLIGVMQQKEKEAGRAMTEEWEREKLRLREQLESCKAKSSTLVSSLETELSKVKVQKHMLEQENLLLKQELDETKRMLKCPELSDLQEQISCVISSNEMLLKEKEALNEELNRCVDKVAKVCLLENVISSLQQEQKSLEQQCQTLRNQLAGSQEKTQSLEETLQCVNLQMSRLKSDLRVTQQEKEALKQEVMSLHKHLQNTKDKVLQGAVHSSGLQNQQKKRYWDDLAQLMEQEQQLLRQENERLQQEVQSTQADLTHSREKIRQLESSVLSCKHQKHQSQANLIKSMEQEKISLKRECEHLQKELASASRKISRMTSLEQELETIRMENEGLKRKQVKLDEQLVEMLHSSSTVMPSQSPHSRELQQQTCTMVPWEQYLKLQQQLQQAERRSQRLQEELESRPLDTNMPQGGHEELLKKMEGRMVDVEQKLRIVKLLLQEKVNQLKEQISKNTKADGKVKDLYVENARLLQALEMTEQRQQTTQKKNLLLEEKIAGLSRIVRDLTPSVTAITTHHLRS